MPRGDRRKAMLRKVVSLILFSVTAHLEAFGSCVAGGDWQGRTRL